MPSVPSSQQTRFHDADDGAMEEDSGAGVQDSWTPEKSDKSDPYDAKDHAEDDVKYDDAEDEPNTDNADEYEYDANSDDAEDEPNNTDNADEDEPNTDNADEDEYDAEDEPNTDNDAEDIAWNDLMTCSRKTHLEEYDGCVKNAILCGEEQKERSPSMCESLRDMSTVNVFVE